MPTYVFPLGMWEFELRNRHSGERTEQSEGARLLDRVRRGLTGVEAKRLQNQER